MEWAKQTYNTQYEKWVPWLEDIFLKYFTKDNKASYATRDNLNKAKVTGIEQVDTLQDGVHSLIAGQVGQGGLGQPVGDAVSKEGLNRFERKGRDDKGRYVSDSTGTSAGGALAQGGQAVADGFKGGVETVGGAVGGLFGGSGGGKKK